MQATGSGAAGQYSAAMWKAISALPWPCSCLVCGAWSNTPCCNGCRAMHARLRPRCPTCGLALAPGLLRCSACAVSPAASLDGVLARVDYAFPWSLLVQRLKFQQSPATAAVLARLMLDDTTAPDLLAHCDLVTPIPLARPRLMERGYNQSWELVKHLRRRTRVGTAVPDLLERTHTGPALHTLPRAERLSQATHLFALPPQHRERVRGASVLLVDDVMTTGATANAAAAALKQAGARSVHVWVFARTPAPSRQE